MEKNFAVFNICLRISRCLGLSYCTMKKSKSGGVSVAKYSKANFFLNGGIAIGFLYVLFQMNLYHQIPSKKVYKTSSLVLPLYTRLVILAIVLFIICGNLTNEKFIAVIDHFSRVGARLEKDFGAASYETGRNASRIFLRFMLCLGVATAVKIWLEFHLVINYQKILRVVHYLCFYYGSLFTVHFAVTMNYVEENYGRARQVFKKLAAEGCWTVGGAPAARRRLGLWTTAFVDLKDAEDSVDEVFGKQIFLTLFLAFTGILINGYYFFSTNLYGTANVWLNVCFVYGLFECVVVTLINANAAESAAGEANRMNETIFLTLLHEETWELYKQLKHFILFLQDSPTQFKCWVFYTLSYESLFKVVLASLAITVIILQCDFLRKNF